MFPSFISSLFGDEGSGQVGSRATEPITSKSTVQGDAKDGISYAFSSMQGWRLTMEDAHMCCTQIQVEGTKEPLRNGHVIFGVFDGHGGDFTSTYAARHFMRIFSSNNRLKKYASMSPFDQENVPGIECLKPALAETFSRLDIEIRKQQNKLNDEFIAQSKQQENSLAKVPKAERSGSTCNVVLVTPSHVISANAGDSRAILRRDGKTLPLSFDHKPNNIPEMERIKKANGHVKSKRIDGDLAVSRGLGDFSYKSNEGLPMQQQKVVPNPDFIIYPRRKKEDEFMILACDGVWDVVSNDQCGSFVQSLLDEGESLSSICEETIDTCLDKNSRDNMTIVIVAFEGCKTSTGALGIKNAIWQRRASRQARRLQQSARKVATRAASNVGDRKSVV